jgi:hypothetical protein
MLTDVSEVDTASIIRTMSEPRVSIAGYIGVQVHWADQWGTADDRWGNGPMADRVAVRSTREKGIVWEWDKTHSTLISPVHLDSYITCYPFARGSLIALMMEAVRTSEMSVNIYLTTRQHIPEDSKLDRGCLRIKFWDGYLNLWEKK